jgi:hypothetical protein
VTSINCQCSGHGTYSAASIMRVLSQAACARAGSESYSLRPGVREREHAAATDDSESKHQLQWTRSMLSREYHASAVTLAGSLNALRVPFRVREREHAAQAVICGGLLIRYGDSEPELPGGRPESRDSRQHPAQDRAAHFLSRLTRRPVGGYSPICGESGPGPRGPFPVSRPNRETDDHDQNDFPIPIPAESESGNGVSFYVSRPNRESGEWELAGGFPGRGQVQVGTGMAKPGP